MDKVIGSPSPRSTSSLQILSSPTFRDNVGQRTGRSDEHLAAFDHLSIEDLERQVQTAQRKLREQADKQDSLSTMVSSMQAVLNSGKDVTDSMKERFQQSLVEVNHTVAELRSEIEHRNEHWNQEALETVRRNSESVAEDMRDLSAALQKISRRVQSWEEKGSWALQRWKRELDEIGGQNQLVTNRLDARVKVLEEQLNTRLGTLTCQVTEATERCGVLARDSREQGIKNSEMEAELAELGARQQAWGSTVQSLAEDTRDLRACHENVRKLVADTAARTQAELSVGIVEQLGNLREDLQGQIRSMQERTEASFKDLRAFASAEAQHRSQTMRDDLSLQVAKETKARESSLQELQANLDKVTDQVRTQGGDITVLQTARRAAEQQTEQVLTSATVAKTRAEEAHLEITHLQGVLERTIAESQQHLRHELDQRATELEKKTASHTDLRVQDARQLVEVVRTEFREKNGQVQKDMNLIGTGLARCEKVTQELAERLGSQDARVRRHGEELEQAAKHINAARDLIEHNTAELRREATEALQQGLEDSRRHCKELVHELEKSSNQHCTALKTAHETENSALNTKVRDCMSSIETLRAGDAELNQRCNWLGKLCTSYEQGLEEARQRDTQCSNEVADFRREVTVWRSSTQEQIQEASRREERSLQEISERFHNQLEIAITETSSQLSGKLDHRASQLEADCIALKTAIAECDQVAKSLQKSTSDHGVQLKRLADAAEQAAWQAERIREQGQQQASEVRRDSAEALRQSADDLRRGYQEAVEESERNAAEAREAARAHAEVEFGSVRSKLRELQGTVETFRGSEAELSQRCEWTAKLVAGHEKMLDEARQRLAQLGAESSDVRAEVNTWPAELRCALADAKQKEERYVEDTAQQIRTSFEQRIAEAKDQLSNRMEAWHATALDAAQEAAREAADVGSRCQNQFKEVWAYCDTYATELRQQADLRVQEMRQLHEKQGLTLHEEISSLQSHLDRGIADLKLLTGEVSKGSTEKWEQQGARLSSEATRLTSLIDTKVIEQQGLWSSQFDKTRHDWEDALRKYKLVIQEQLDEAQRSEGDLRKDQIGAVTTMLAEVEHRLREAIEAHHNDLSGKLREVQRIEEKRTAGLTDDITSQTTRLREEMSSIERGVSDRIHRHLLAVTGEVAGVRRDLGDRIRSQSTSRATALSMEGNLADGLVAAARTHAQIISPVPASALRRNTA